jgi:hypothetical protein
MSCLPPRWRNIVPPRRIDALYSWMVAGANQRRPRTFDVLFDGGGPLVRTTRRAELLSAFETSLRAKVALLARGYVFIHAGVVGWRGRAIVLPGRTYTGKSTLVAALVEAGADYLSDEFAVLDRRGRVHPFPTPIGIRSSSGIQSAVPVATRAEGPLPVGLILATGFRQRATFRPQERSPGQGVLALIANAVAARAVARQVVESSRTAAAGARALRGARGEADEMVGPLLAACTWS